MAAPADLVRDCFCQLLPVRLVGVLIEHPGKFLPRDRIQPLRRADPRLLIEPEIQRSIHLKREAALRIVDLHGRHAKIRQNKVEAADLFCDLIDRAEILKAHRQKILPESQILQTLFRLGGLLRVHIGRPDMSLSFQTFQHGTRVPAVAERRIKSLLSGLNLQKVQNFFYHNRDMHSRRRISLPDHMLDRILIFLRL